MRRALWVLLVAGFIIRVALALTTRGTPGDLESYRVTADALRHDLFGVYAAVNPAPFPHWPYPPAYFAWLAPIGFVDDRTAFEALVRLPPILADLVLAWLAQDLLARRGAAPATRLAGTALIALGPLFIAISSVHGHIDSLAMLPAALGIAAWERGIVPRRALAAGALIGVGAAIKTVPGLLLLAVLPRSASRREAAVAAGAAVAVPFLLLVPFALATPDAIDIVARYHGAPGLGSLSLVVQPDLPSGWFGQRLVERSALTDGLQDLRTPIVLAALGTLGLWLARVRPAPFVAAAMVWLTFYVFGVNFFLQYAVWGLVFLILAGELRMAVVLQALVLAPLLVTYAHVRGARAVDVLYSVPMLAFWGASLTMLVMLGARGLRRDRTDFVPIR